MTTPTSNVNSLLLIDPNPRVGRYSTLGDYASLSRRHSVSNPQFPRRRRRCHIAEDFQKKYVLFVVALDGTPYVLKELSARGPTSFGLPPDLRFSTQPPESTFPQIPFLPKTIGSVRDAEGAVSALVIRYYNVGTLEEMLLSPPCPEENCD